jgi:hypothetical protein
MLRVCALKYGNRWDKSLPYAEFLYNNSYQASIKMTPFEALYGYSVELRCFGVKLEKAKYLDREY